MFCALVKQSRIFSQDGQQFDSQYNQASILFEPPKQLKYLYYRCDAKFHLDTVLDMYEDDETYGVCLISGEDIMIYTVNVFNDNFDIKLIDDNTIELQTRTRRGGSSSGRYGRINDKAKHFNKISFSEMIVDAYMTDNHTKCKVKIIILAGPTDMKKDVSETPLFQQHLKKYLFKFVNTNGIHQTTAEIVMSNILNEIKYADVKEVDSELNKLIQYKYDMLTIGENESKEFISNNNIVKLFVCKSQIQNKIQKDYIEELKTTISVIFTESSTLKTYGGWIGIKKYNQTSNVIE